MGWLVREQRNSHHHTYALSAEVDCNGSANLWSRARQKYFFHVGPNRVQNNSGSQRVAMDDSDA
jgi:hypothetical protein